MSLQSPSASPALLGVFFTKIIRNSHLFWMTANPAEFILPNGRQLTRLPFQVVNTQSSPIH
jgi:hypothetical protein